MVNDYLVRRSFNVLYIWIDAILLLAFLCILARTRRRAAFVVGLLGGVAYLVVDYGFFYALLGTRTVVGMSVLPVVGANVFSGDRDTLVRCNLAFEGR